MTAIDFNQLILRAYSNTFTWCSINWNSCPCTLWRISMYFCRWTKVVIRICLKSNRIFSSNSSKWLQIATIYRQKPVKCVVGIIMHNAYVVLPLSWKSQYKNHPPSVSVLNGTTRLNGKFHADVSRFPIQMLQMAWFKATTIGNALLYIEYTINRVNLWHFCSIAQYISVIWFRPSKSLY